jgi:hypothetical protein
MMEFQMFTIQGARLACVDLNGALHFVRADHVDVRGMAVSAAVAAMAGKKRRKTRRKAA